MAISLILLPIIMSTLLINTNNHNWYIIDLLSYQKRLTILLQTMNWNFWLMYWCIWNTLNWINVICCSTNFYHLNKQSLQLLCASSLNLERIVSSNMNCQLFWCLSKWDFVWPIPICWIITYNGRRTLILKMESIIHFRDVETFNNGDDVLVLPRWKRCLTWLLSWILWIGLTCTKIK